MKYARVHNQLSTFADDYVYAGGGGVELPFGPKKTVKISLFIEDLSRNSVFWKANDWEGNPSF